LLIHGKIEDEVDNLPDFDLLLTDPPYGLDTTTLSSSNSHKKQGRSRHYKVYDWMKKGIPDQKLIDKLIEKANYSIIWGGNYFRLEPSQCWLVWEKETACNYADAILAWTNMPGSVRSITWQWSGMVKEKPEDRWHPTQMPEAIINFSLDQFEKKVGRKPTRVVDPFAGSGTTLVCCQKRGIDYIGVEMIDEYVDIINKRLSQKTLFQQEVITQ
jgi:site-specific DNA-methyltransferase (adenine-specific)